MALEELKPPVSSPSYQPSVTPGITSYVLLVCTIPVSTRACDFLYFYSYPSKHLLSFVFFLFGVLHEVTLYDENHSLIMSLGTKFFREMKKKKTHTGSSVRFGTMSPGSSLESPMLESRLTAPHDEI